MRLQRVLPAPLARLAYRLAWRALVLSWRLRRPEAHGAATLVVHGGKLLVVRPTYRDEWGLPGGLVDPGEEPRAAAARELLEETGIRVSPDRLEPLGAITFERFRARFHVAIFAWWPAAAPQPEVDRREIAAAAYMDEAALAAAATGPDVALVLERHAARLFMVHADPSAR